MRHEQSRNEDFVFESDFRYIRGKFNLLNITKKAETRKGFNYIS